MNKRKEAFLEGKAYLEYFTPKSLETNFGFTKEEVEEMIKQGEIEVVPRLECTDCFRFLEEDNAFEPCKYCGCEDKFTNHSFYQRVEKVTN